MMCCVGFFGGLVIGQYLGGPYTYIAPGLGFIFGLVGDLKLMGKHSHGNHFAMKKKTE